MAGLEHIMSDLAHRPLSTGLLAHTHAHWWRTALARAQRVVAVYTTAWRVAVYVAQADIKDVAMRLKKWRDDTELALRKLWTARQDRLNDLKWSTSKLERESCKASVAAADRQHRATGGLPVRGNGLVDMAGHVDFFCHYARTVRAEIFGGLEAMPAPELLNLDMVRPRLSGHYDGWSAVSVQAVEVENKPMIMAVGWCQDVTFILATVYRETLKKNDAAGAGMSHRFRSSV